MDTNIHNITLTKARISIQKPEDDLEYLHKMQKWKIRDTRKVRIQEKVSQENYDLETLKNKLIE